MGIFLEALQRHGTSGRIADQSLRLIAPMRRDLGVGVEGKPVDAGTAGARERGMFPCITKPRPKTPHLLTGSLSKGDALLHRGSQGAGELGRVIDQRIMPRSHGGIDARLQIPQMA